MPAQLTSDDGEALLRAEEDIRARLGHLPLDFAALQADFCIVIWIFL